MKKAFTLIEMLVSISILSMIMLFLYKTHSSLRISNDIFKTKALQIKDEECIKKVIFLDFSLALPKSISILNQDKKTDIVFMQTANSMHHRYNPYVAYIFQDSKLYRIESLKEFVTYPLDAGVEFSAQFFSDADIFRVYPSQKAKNRSYLVHIDFKDFEDVLLKVRVLQK